MKTLPIALSISVIHAPSRPLPSTLLQHEERRYHGIQRAMGTLPAKIQADQRKREGRSQPDVENIQQNTLRKNQTNGGRNAAPASRPETRGADTSNREHIGVLAENVEKRIDGTGVISPTNSDSASGRSRGSIGLGDGMSVQ